MLNGGNYSLMLRLPGMGVTLFVDDVADFLAGAATAAKHAFPLWCNRK